MTVHEWVVVAMVGIPVIYIGIDVAIVIRGGPTYSSIISGAAKKFLPLGLLISFGFGLLAGHWFW